MSVCTSDGIAHYWTAVDDSLRTFCDVAIVLADNSRFKEIMGNEERCWNNDDRTCEPVSCLECLGLATGRR